MGLRIFLIIILVISFISLIIPVDNSGINSSAVEKPVVTFKDPLMYTIMEQGVVKIVKSDFAYKYKNREEMTNGHITLYNFNKIKNFKKEYLESDKIVKKNLLYILTDNVLYKRDNFIKLNTDELYYDDKKRIVYNYLPFTGEYKGSYISGEKAYVDINKDTFDSKKTKFTIKIKNEDKK